MSDEQPIYYMRDNHTFKRLSNNVSTALIEIEQEFNDGYTYGALCSKREGFPTVNASGSGKRLEFFAECKVVLERVLDAPTDEPYGWIGEHSNQFIKNVGQRDVKGLALYTRPQPAEEPVVRWDSDGWGDLLVDSLPDGTLLYTRPQPAACDMGKMCLDCQPRNADGSCPDAPEHKGTQS